MFTVKGKYSHNDTDDFANRFVRPFMRQMLLLSIGYVFSFLGYLIHEYGIGHLLISLKSPLAAHVFASAVVAWLLPASLVWIGCIGSIRYAAFANIWYWASVVFMTIMLAACWLLLPETGKYMGQMIYATLPLQLFIFIFINYLQPKLMFLLPLLLIGLGAMIYGFIA